MDTQEREASADERKRAEAEIRRRFERDLDDHLRDRDDPTLTPDDDRAIFAFADRAVSAYHAATLGTPSLPALSRTQYAEVRQALYLSHTSLGPLRDLLAEAGVEDIHINGTREVVLNYGDRQERMPSPFRSDEELVTLVRFYAEVAGKHIDPGNPIVTVTLPDGSRLNAILRPIAKPTVVTIRRHQLGRFQHLEDLARAGAIPTGAIRLLRTAVRGRLNTILSGPTGCGKTTFARVLALLIPEHERTCVLETETELWLHDLRDHFFSLEEREANVENAGRITLRDLFVKGALRQRPRRIIVGEVRGEEALDMLRAMTSGHPGSLTTLHANTPREAVSTLQMLAMSSEPHPPAQVVDQLVGRGVDMVVHLEQYESGGRELRRLAAICFVDHNPDNPSLPIVMEVCRYEAPEDRWIWQPDAVRYMPAKVQAKFAMIGENAFNLAREVEGAA